jgi:O-antigen/teichoic acid export membrane protein
VSTIILVFVLLFGWKGRVYSMSLSTVLFGFLSIYMLYKRGYFIFKLSKEYTKNALVFALPLIPHALSFWLRSGVDKILLTKMCGIAENGLYSVAMTWAAIVGMFSTAFSNAYSPYLYKKLAEFDQNKTGTVDEQKKLIKMIYGIICVSIIFVFFAYWVSRVFIKLVYAPAYHAATQYLPYIMMGQFFQVCYLLFVCFAHYTFKTKILGIMTFSLSLIQIVLSYWFIMIFGSIGTAISSVIGSALIFFSVAIYGITIYKLPWFSFYKK